MLWGEWKPKENHFPQKSCRTHLFSSAESYGVSVQLSSGIIRSSSEVWFWSGDSMEQLPGRQVSTWRVLQGSGGFMGWLLDSLPGASKRSRTRRILGGFWEGLRGLSRAPQCWLGGIGWLLEWVPKKITGGSEPPRSWVPKELWLQLLAMPSAYWRLFFGVGSQRKPIFGG